MKLLLSLIVAVAASALTSCKNGPTIKRANGDLITLGQSALLKQKTGYSKITMEDGTVLEDLLFDMDQTLVPRAAITGHTLVTGIKSALSLGKAQEATTQALDKGVTTRAASENATKLGLKEIESKTTLGTAALKQ